MTLKSIEAFERSGLLAWPGIEVEWDRNWVRRAAGGYTKRANSIQCLDPGDGENTPQRLAAGVEWLRKEGVAPVVRSCPLESPELTAALDGQGWRTIDRSHLYATALGTHEADPQGRLLPLLDPDFLAAQQRLQGHDHALMDRMRALLSVMAVPATGVVIYRDGEPAASGLMAIADGIVVAGNIITGPARRREGLASATMRTGLDWARRNGATVAALNVQADNNAAKALYQGLGYTHQYNYCYRVPGAA